MGSVAGVKKRTGACTSAPGGQADGRQLGGGTAPNRNQANVNSILISLIVAGDPAAGLARGVETNDKNYLTRFPFLAPAHQGLLQGHGGINTPAVQNIPIP